MDLTRLAAKQKRVLEIRDFIKNEVQNSNLKATLTNALIRYSKLIASCWEEKGISETRAIELLSLERDLESLHEEARLIGGKA